MSVLAFKALSYGAEQIPDKFFEKIPGGFFTPSEKKDIDKGRKVRKDRERRKSEERSSRRNSRRERSPATDHSDYSAYDDTDYERERARRKKEQRRAKSVGKDPSRSFSRGRRNRHSSDLDGQSSDPKDMAHAEQGGPYFPPPPTSEYRPYNPQEYAPSPVQDHRPSATPAYGYSPQVNINSSFRRATLATMPEHPTPVSSCPPMSRSRTMSNSPTPFPLQPRLLDTVFRGSPLSVAFTPSSEPPLATLLQQPPTNSLQPAAAFPVQQSFAQSASASRYTPGPGYAPSPVVNPQTPIPPPPVGSNSPYNPYNPADYSASSVGYQPTPPPFTRQRSNSQPSLVPGSSVPYSAYTPPSAGQQQIAAYNGPPSRRDSTKPRREHRHRARSADSHSHSQQSRSSKDHRRDDPRMTKVRDRFDSMDLREKSLAASVGGAAAGALGARGLATRSRSRSDRRSSSRSRSRSRTRTHDRERSKDRSLRARSRSVIDRFRSKSRGPGEREVRKDRHDRRPDHGYDYGREDYDYFSNESEGDGSPVKTRRRRKRDY
ncbi:hypothetical protein EJ02DRAFT_344042 [Clathrospora elynae]|uniref:Uncharacterized protein n=1 Tax=Clathrospora elynae TaxID=706981 RepID=A0A6A5T219_9PLEO|nr:hypothetical protein EJ02DRAFT_344042 [Clathrospora elynae]